MATPVHCWHHHLYEVSDAPTAHQPDNEDHSLSSFKGPAMQNHCDICAHPVAVYEPASAWEYRFIARQQPTTYAVYHATALTAAVHQFSNKGPPAGSIA